MRTALAMILPTALAALLPLTASAAAPVGAVDFVRDVRPILAQNCYACHGPDAEHREAGLRLDTEDGARATLESEKKALEVKDPTRSELLARIIHTNPKRLMPPAKSGKKLTPEQIAILQKWVAQGSPWAKHWAFSKPAKVPEPVVTHKDWPTSPIDRFVLARLEREGLTPSPDADRVTMARRVSLDLTGLPPTPEQIDSYIKDSSPAAYEAYVDRLLASSAFGERWARVWLDLARFADTKGYEKDKTRHIWPYRDWLISALNRDLPYDQFTIEQLAGDLLPNAREDQIVATAFNRNTMTNEEGGVDAEEFRVNAVKDRVDTTVQVWMGLTMGCAKCHSHKYDPISQTEYYRFYGFLNQTQDANRGDESPTLPITRPDQKAANEKVEAEIAALRKQLDTPTPELEAAQAKWEAAQGKSAKWETPVVVSATSEGKSKLTVKPDGSILASGPRPVRDTYTVTLRTSLTKLTGVRLEALTDPSLGDRGGPGRNPEDPNFVVNTFAMKLAPAENPKEAIDVKFGSAAADFEQKGWPARGAIDDKVLTGWAISPKQGQPHVLVLRPKEPFGHDGGSLLTITIDQQYGQSLTLGRFRITLTNDGDPRVNLLPPEIATIQVVPASERKPDQKGALAAYYRSIAPELDSVRGKLRELAVVKGKSVPLPVMRELPADKRRVTRIHKSGSFLSPGDEVTPAVPAAFHQLPVGATPDRLAMARWLASTDNPLTARVLVNRYWAQFFGTGIVETQEDFGTQGTPPTHPELLDWMAVDFIENGWSMKRLCRSIVLSHTYRQSSKATPEHLARDRFNRLLARGPRVRLDAEQVRDNALTIAGLLSHKIGGPSVMPMQPPGIWASVYSGEKWETSPGEDRYRRGIYTFVKRTSPYPSMVTFDGSSRETCIVRRIVTNTPLQALVMLNDPVYLEAAQSLARASLVADPATTEGRVAFAVRRATCRPATTLEVKELTSLFERRQSFFKDHAVDAKQFATDPLGPLPAGVDPADAAAMTAVCNAILNLDVVLTKE